MNLRNMILESPNYILVRDAGDGRTNARSLYEVALMQADLPPDTKEDPIYMFKRAGDLAFGYIRELKHIAADMFENLGGGVLPPRIEDLTPLEAKDFFDIVEAQHHAEALKASLVNYLLAYSARKVDL